MSQNRAKRLSGINTLAYLGIEPITAPLLIVKFNNEIPTTDDRVGNQIGALWISMNTAASAPNARIFFLTRLDGSGPSGIATWTEVQTGGTGPGVDFVTTDDGNTAIPVFGNLNVFGGLTDRTGIMAQNITTYNDPAGSDNVFIALEESIFLPDTTDINNGVIGLGGTTDANRFMHNFGANGGVDSNTFLGLASGNFTLTGTNLVGIGDGALVSTTSGSENTAVGSGAGSSLTTGNFNTLVGSLAGAAFDSASNVVAVGARAAQLTTGSDLVVIGATAAQLATTISNSVIIGSNAVGTGNATGSDNVIIGQQAAENLTSGSDNTIIGFQSGNNITTGSRNELIGKFSGFAITSGFDNVAIGYDAAVSLTTGTQSVYIGTQAGQSLIASSNNVAIGYNALLSETTTSNTVAIGFNAGFAQNGGTLNTFIGTQAGEDLTTATTTTLVGYRAGTNITTGIANTSLGASTLLNATTQEANTAIGGTALISHNGGTGQNTAVGFGSLAAVTSGSFNTALGWSTGLDAPTGLTTGNYNTFIGHWAGNAFTSDETSNVIINSLGVASDDNTLRIGQATGAGQQELNRAFICGIRGIATAVVNAIPVLIDSANQLGTVSSSARYKDNIQDMGEESSPVMDLRPVTFTYKSDEQKRIQYGLIAEEVEQVMPLLVVYDEDGLPQSVRYHDLPQILLNELKKLEKRVAHIERIHESCKHIC